MPFVASVVAAIISAVETIASIIATIASTIGAAIEAGGAALGGIVEDVFKAIGSKVGGALGALFHLSGLVLGSIDQEIISVLGVIQKVVTTVDTFIQGILKPIQDLFTSLSALFDVVNKDYQAVTTLVDELHADLHAGIKGLLEIPKTISDALTSVESQTIRAVKQINQGTADTTKNILVPGMSDTIGDPLKSLHDVLSTGKVTPENLTAALQHVTLTQCAADQAIAESNKYIHALSNLGSDLGVIVATAVTAALKPLLVFAAASRFNLTCIEQDAAAKLPVTLLGLGDIVEAQFRGILDATEALQEAARHGVAGERFKTLLENGVWLPSPREALVFFWRGLIDHKELVSILAKRHLTATDADALEKMVPEPVNPRELISIFGREVTAGAGFLAKSMTSDAPDNVQKAYLPLGLAPTRALVDWRAHWRIPDADWWLTRYVRGLGSLDDAKNAAVAANYPDEILDDLLPVFQETIQLWMVPDVLATGLLTDKEAQDYLHYIGVGPRDADLLIKWGKTKQTAPLSAMAATLQSISASNAKAMFQDGIIQAATYVNILEAHGYTSEAATLTVDLAQQELDIKARKNYVDGLVAEVDAGLLTLQQMTDRLYAQGYTEVQIVEAANKVHAAKVANAKQPTKAEWTDFLRFGVIDGDTYLGALVSIGYSAQAAAYFYELEVAQHGEPPKPASSGQGGS